MNILISPGTLLIRTNYYEYRIQIINTCVRFTQPMITNKEYSSVIIRCILGPVLGRKIKKLFFFKGVYCRRGIEPNTGLNQFLKCVKSFCKHENFFLLHSFFLYLI